MQLTRFTFYVSHSTPQPECVNRTYDLAMTHKLDADDLFIHSVQQACAVARLNFFLIEPLWVEAFHRALERGEVRTRALLNMHSEHHQPEEIFHRLVRLAAEQGAFVIDPPDRAQAAFDKSRLHPRLVAAGIPVPHSVIVEPVNGDAVTLTSEERASLGTPFVIKPGMGYGRRGLVLDAVSEADLARSAAAWPDARYLFQRKIVPAQHDGAPLYWRAYFVFDRVWLCWWNCYTDQYHLVTAAERVALGLARVEEITRQIAALTGMTFFSSEIARTESGEFVVIDYVNDQCLLLSQTSNPQIGVPDDLVIAIAQRLVEGTVEALGLQGRGSPVSLAVG